jgi:hypothetical protein
MDADLAAKLRALADRVRRNVPLRHDPEHFHVEKACLCQDLEYLASQIEEQGVNLTINRQRRAVTGYLSESKSWKRS